MNPVVQNLIALMRNRHSCRDFLPDPLDKESLEILYEAFSLAPQAGGGRNLCCAFITDRARIAGIAAAGKEAFDKYCAALPSDFVREEMQDYGENFFWFSNASVLASISCRREPPFLQEVSGSKAGLLWGGEQSASMGAFALLLAAESLDIGACCLSGPLAVYQEMEELLEIPGRENLILLVALGKRRVKHD